MKSLLLLALVGASNALTEGYVRANAQSLWSGFKKQYGRTYSEDEEAIRYQTFAANLVRAAQQNLAEGPDGATFGMNQFADMTAEEFKARNLLSKRSSVRAAERQEFTGVALAKAKAATKKDWRNEGAVTGVKDQGQCGSCWAFSSVGGIEGGNFVKNGVLTSLSEQELTSCEKADFGCNGGLQENAFDFLVQKHGGNIVTEAAYPYTSGRGRTGTCALDSSMEVGATITGYKLIARDNEQVKAALLAHGPLSVSVDAGPWQLYTGGILKNACTTRCQLDHGVTAVGFGEAADGTSYWIIKNSWSASWGEAGYIRVAFGYSGITDEALYPTF